MAKSDKILYIAYGLFLILAFISGILGLPKWVFADYNINTASTVHNQIQGIGLSANQIAGTSFTTVGAGTISSVSMLLEKNGSPVDNIVIAIKEDNCTSWTVADLGSATYAGSSLGTCSGNSYHTFTFGSAVSVNASTKYWIVFYRDGSASGSNYYVGCGDDGGDPYAGGEYRRYDGSSYTTYSAHDLNTNFTVTETGSTWNLAVTTSGVGSGTITSSPAGINTSSSANYDFDANSTTTLTATADSGSVFVTWDNSCATTNPCDVYMDDDYIIDAEFATTTSEALASSTPMTALTDRDKLLISSFALFLFSFVPLGFVFNRLA